MKKFFSQKSSCFFKHKGINFLTQTEGNNFSIFRIDLGKSTKLAPKIRMLSSFFKQ